MSLLVLAAVVACIARTVTQEEVFREFKDWCVHHSKRHPHLTVRKVCYLFTCEYCFSHWVTLVVLLLTGYRLETWGGGGLFVTLFTIVWIANVYLGLFAWLKLAVRYKRAQAAHEEHLAKPPGWFRWNNETE